jgi:hypothetical protein
MVEKAGHALLYSQGEITDSEGKLRAEGVPYKGHVARGRLAIRGHTLLKGDVRWQKMGGEEWLDSA